MSRANSRRGAWQSSAAQPHIPPVASGPTKIIAKADPPMVIDVAPVVAPPAPPPPTAPALPPDTITVSLTDLRQIVRETVEEVLNARVPIRAPARGSRVAARFGLDTAATSDAGEDR